MTVSFQFNQANKITSSNEQVNPSNEMTWLKEFKENALTHFTADSLPTRKTEAWKYNDLSALNQADFNLAAASYSTIDCNLAKNEIVEKLNLEQSTVVLFVNGRYSIEGSSTLLTKDVLSTRFCDANDSQQATILNALSLAVNKDHFLGNLNSAVNDNGLLIEIEKNAVIDRPVHILHINTAVDSKYISTNQVIVNCGAGSQSQVIEHFVSMDLGQNHLALQQSIIQLADNCRCQHFRLNLESQTSSQVSQVVGLINQDARLESFYFSHGSQLNKTDITIKHLGKNSESDLTGIYLPSGTSNIDYHTTMEHQVPHCTSREVFRGIIADSAKATFNGKIHIFRDAQKSDAQLSNKNLLLTNQAEINTKPELEIYADDVVCAHGATVAKIDDKAIYYLQSRGINEQHARQMLSVGFIKELLNKITIPELYAFLTEQIESVFKIKH